MQAPRALAAALPAAMMARSVCRSLALAGLPSAALSASSRRFLSASPFERAAKLVTTLPAANETQTKLQLYALFKQATVGPNTQPKPGLFDVVGKYKWEAWTALGSMPKADAERAYVELVERLGGGGSTPASGEAGAAAPSASASAGSHVLSSLDPATGVLTITLNRPEKRNAWTKAMYVEVGHALGALAPAPTPPPGGPSSVRAVLLTGAGPLFTAGNDMANFAGTLPPGGIREAAQQARVLLEAFVLAFLDCPVPVVVAVNGPAVGIGVTLLPLCDLVYASHKATFHTPFTSLGLAPEACSSVTFPRLMGVGRANEALLLGRKLTAQEAAERGLVTAVVEDSQLASTARKAAEALAALPPGSVAASKRLVREGGWNAEELRAANRRECAVLAERWASPEAAEAIVRFLSGKGK